jgi:hypothetical protein
MQSGGSLRTAPSAPLTCHPETLRFSLLPDPTAISGVSQGGKIDRLTTAGVLPQFDVPSGVEFCYGPWLDVFARRFNAAAAPSKPRK